MKTIPAHLLDQVSGGDSAAAGAGSALAEVPASELEGGGGFESAWEGSGGFESSQGPGSWSLDAIGIEGGPMAVVTISGSSTAFDNTPPIEDYGPGEAPWEGAYLGTWVEPAPISYEHTALDGALIANTGRLAGAAATAFIDGALTGAGVGATTANPVGVLADWSSAA